MHAAGPKIIHFHSGETREFKRELEVSSKYQNAFAVICYFKTIIAEKPGTPAPLAFRRGKAGRYPLKGRRGCRNGVR